MKPKQKKGGAVSARKENPGPKLLESLPALFSSARRHVLILHYSADGQTAKIACATAGVRRFFANMPGLRLGECVDPSFFDICLLLKDGHKKIVEYSFNGSGLYTLSRITTCQLDADMLMLEIHSNNLSEKDSPDTPEETQGLTAAQYRVLSVLHKGKSNKEIAQELGIAVNTVRAHLRDIFKKLGVDSRLKVMQAAQSIFNAQCNDI